MHEYADGPAWAQHVPQAAPEEAGGGEPQSAGPAWPVPMPGLTRSSPGDGGQPTARRVQTKLVVGASADVEEREADDVARRVIDALRRDPQGADGDEPAADTDTDTATGAPTGAETADTVHRAPAAHAPDTGATVGPAGGELDEHTASRLEQMRAAGGRAMDAPVRRRFENAMGVDLSDVRLHSGPAATDLNDGMSARAFTVGRDIFFRDGLPATDTTDGQSLLAHELTHTVQQSGVRRSTGTIRREGTTAVLGKDAEEDDAPDPVLDPVKDWVAYSTVKGTFGKKSRSPALKGIDNAVTGWLTGGANLGGAPKVQLEKLSAITDAIDAFKKAKGEKASIRDDKVNGLLAAVKVLADDAAMRLKARTDDEEAAAGLLSSAQQMDSETGKFAKRNAVDVQVSNYKKDSQTPGLMALTKKNKDGTLTDEALDYFDKDGVEKAKEIKSKASKMGFASETDLDDKQLKQIMEKQKNALTGRTEIPELENIGVDNGEAQGEKTEPLSDGATVTYDASDVHAEERLGAVRGALDVIKKAGVPVPAVEIYLPKFGREVKVAADCSVTFPTKVADAQFIAPGFVYINSQNTGNPKTMKTGNELNYLSARLGADNALMHSIIHELGHAAHYFNDRQAFHNLGWSSFKPGQMSDKDKRKPVDVVSQEVSPYAAGNPREMVAEVFLGTLLGKKFPDIIWEMYASFGGAPLAH
jgi:hypothetical protein